MSTKYLKQPVEKFLNETDYEFMGYMPSTEALLFVNFIKEVNNGQEENETPPVHLKMMDTVFNGEKRCAILCHRGIGKLETENSPILTPTGWSTMGNVQVGDRVIDRYGKPTKITFKTDAQYPETYLMTLTDGTTMEVGDLHNHIVWLDRRTPTIKRKTEKVMTTLELLNKGLTRVCNKKTTRHAAISYKFGIPLVDPIEFNHKTLSISPYMMGLGLANGYFKNGQISCHADDMLELGKYLSLEGHAVSNMRILGEHAGQLKYTANTFSKYRTLKSSTKFIPKEYLFSSIAQRTELLRGLMDGDGHIAKNGRCSYGSINKQLAIDVRDLARSLGAISYIKEYDRGYIEYSVVINIKINPFKLLRKSTVWKPTKKMTKGIVSIEPIGKQKGYCIQVDSNSHSYIKATRLLIIPLCLQNT